MKIRVFRDMDNAVYRIVINTEDWSQGDLELMARFGEPEIDVGGEIQYHLGNEDNTKTFGNELIRLMHGFPYSRGFDSRDYGSYEEAVAVGLEWKEEILRRINDSVRNLRSKHAELPTEEVLEI
jgi:hypothetical protein